MKISRKELLRLMGATFLGGGISKALGALADPSEPQAAGGQTVRWGMVVDSTACAAESDCQECRQACNKAHNVPDVPVARQEVKWIWKESRERVFPFQDRDGFGPEPAAGLPVLCNHCAQPPCVPVCPTQATWKRADGIVMMDYHRCIGCRFCMAACPYGSRSFNFVDPRPYVAPGNTVYPTRTQGVVEKCNFCEERLAVGQQPACVEACPAGALTFGDLNDETSAVRALLRERLGVQRRAELGTGPSVFYLV